VTAMTLMGLSGTAWAQKTKPAPAPNAVGSVTLADGPDYELTGDGAAYEGATIYSSGGTLYLDLAPSGRTMTINLKPENVGQTDGSNHVAPISYAANSVFRIDNVSTAPVDGSWMRSVGRIGFGASLPNHALGFRYATANGVPVYGTEVCVRRVLVNGVRVVPATWVVASSDACFLEDGQDGQAGLFEEGLKGKGYQFEAVYKVRFLATVVCTSSCPQ
jgi:hypothetical protein